MRVSKVALLKLSLMPSSLLIASARSGSMPSITPLERNSTGLYVMSEPTWSIAFSWTSLGSFLNSGALTSRFFFASRLAMAASVWSPQALSSSSEAATAAAAATAVRDLPAAVRRVVLAVMLSLLRMEKPTEKPT